MVREEKHENFGGTSCKLLMLNVVDTFEGKSLN